MAAPAGATASVSNDLVAIAGYIAETILHSLYMLHEVLTREKMFS
jgi:hypothetical protein